jgi:hypothetical protein
MITILVCAAMLTPGDCTSETARDVLRTRAEGTLCALSAEQTVASTNLVEGDYMKIVCRM